MYYQILSQILSGTSVPETRRAFENDLRINEDIYGKYQENNHGLLLELLKEREQGSQPFRVASTASITTPSRKEAEISSELEGLKEQLVMLLKTNHKSENNSTFEL